MLKTAQDVAMHLILTHGSEELDKISEGAMNEVLRLIILAQENAVLKTLKAVNWNCHIKPEPSQCTRCRMGSRWNAQELSGLTVDICLTRDSGAPDKILSLRDLKPNEIFNGNGFPMGSSYWEPKKVDFGK